MKDSVYWGFFIPFFILVYRKNECQFRYNEWNSTRKPFHKIKVKFKESITLSRIIPREEIEQLLNYIYKFLKQNTTSDHKCILRDVAVIELFFTTGARVYEISNIKEENITPHMFRHSFKGQSLSIRYLNIC